MKIKFAVVALFFFTSATCAGIIKSNKYIATDSTFRPYLIAFVVEDVGKTAEWYKDKLDFEVTREMNFPEYDSLKIIFMKSGETELELIQKKTSFSIKKYVPDYNGFDKAPLRGIAKIAFWVNDINTLAHKLKKMSVKFLVAPYDDKDFSLRSFIIEDLNGNILQFNQRL